MTISGNPKDRMDDLADASEVDSAVEEKKVDENGDGHEEQAPESIFDENRRLIAEAQKLIDDGRKRCRDGIKLAKKIHKMRSIKEGVEVEDEDLDKN